MKPTESENSRGFKLESIVYALIGDTTRFKASKCLEFSGTDRVKIVIQDKNKRRVDGSKRKENFEKELLERYGRRNCPPHLNPTYCHLQIALQRTQDYSLSFRLGNFLETYL